MTNKTDKQSWIPQNRCSPLSIYPHRWLPWAVTPPVGGQRHRLEAATLCGGLLAPLQCRREQQGSAVFLPDFALYAHPSAWVHLRNNRGKKKKKNYINTHTRTYMWVCVSVQMQKLRWPCTDAFFKLLLLHIVHINMKNQWQYTYHHNPNLSYHVKCPTETSSWIHISTHQDRGLIQQHTKLKKGSCTLTYVCSIHKITF